MSTDFSRTLALLRQERGVSQRQVARELGISQALLSHYENGVREPGLAFVRKVCSYYHVSADYLLGRTLSRDGAVIEADELYDSSGEKGTLRGSIAATLQKKLLVNAINMLFELLGRIGSREAIAAAGRYLAEAFYALYRPLHRACGANDAFFALGGAAFTNGAVDGAMHLDRAAYLAALAAAQEGGASFPPMESDALGEAYPGLAQSVTQVLHTADERVGVLMQP